MKETLSTIAKRLGVSCSTVSRVLSGDHAINRIPPQTAKIIIEEARRCGYTPKSSRGKKGSATIGLVLPSMGNPFFSEMASVIITEANGRGYTTVLIDTLEDEFNQRNGINTLLSRKVEGIIVAPCGGEDQLTGINENGTPIVMIDRYFDDNNLPYVTTNNYTGGAIATRNLIDYGHKNIVCIQGVQSSAPNKMRVQGYLDQMEKAGLSDKSKVVGHEFSIQNGYIETRLLLSGQDRPSAIFALSNTIGLGAMKAIQEMNLRIPEDISLISFDNNVYLDFMTPPVSRICQPIEDMARIATKLLFETIRDGIDTSKPSSQIMLSPKFIMGGSVRSMK